MIMMLLVVLLWRNDVVQGKKVMRTEEEKCLNDYAVSCREDYSTRDLLDDPLVAMEGVDAIAALEAEQLLAQQLSDHGACDERVSSIRL